MGWIRDTSLYVFIEMEVWNVDDKNTDYMHMFKSLKLRGGLEVLSTYMYNELLSVSIYAILKFKKWDQHFFCVLVILVWSIDNILRYLVFKYVSPEALFYLQISMIIF
jgi:hypothetical protein